MMYNVQRLGDLLDASMCVHVEGIIDTSLLVVSLTYRLK